MMDLVAVEQAILLRLRETIGGVKSAAFPPTDADGRLPPLGGDREILVRWLGDALPTPPPNPQGSIEQLAGSQWETFIRYRNAKGAGNNPHHGAYALVAEVDAALKGFTVPGVADASVLFPIRRQFQGEAETIWQYSILWQFTAPEVS